jgi:hypothetical protein
MRALARPVPQTVLHRARHIILFVDAHVEAEGLLQEMRRLWAGETTGG